MNSTRSYPVNNTVLLIQNTKYRNKNSQFQNTILE